MYFSVTFSSFEHLRVSSPGMRPYAFSISINVTVFSLALSVFHNCPFQSENRICCAPTWNEPNRSFMYIGALSHPPTRHAVIYLNITYCFNSLTPRYSSYSFSLEV